MLPPKKIEVKKEAAPKVELKHAALACPSCGTHLVVIPMPQQTEKVSEKRDLLAEGFGAKKRS